MLLFVGGGKKKAGKVAREGETAGQAGHKKGPRTGGTQVGKKNGNGALGVPLPEAIRTEGSAYSIFISKVNVFVCHFDEHSEEKSRYGERFLTSFEMTDLRREVLLCASCFA